MVSRSNVIVTTTSTLDGWEIQEYKGIVTSEIVAGVNLFRDIAASWRNVFGGQSKGYRKELERIRQQALKELRSEAVNRGANAIIGVRVDHDPISQANGQNMLMVTAQGTAVRALQQETATPDADTETGRTSAEALKVEMKTRELQAVFDKSPNVYLEPGEWDFVIANQVEALSAPISQMLAQYIQRGARTAEMKTYKERATEYLYTISERAAKDALYNMVAHSNWDVVHYAVQILKDRQLLDLKWVPALLTHDDFDVRKRALDVLMEVDRPVYTTADVQKLRTLLANLQEHFPKQGEVIEVEKSGMFASGTKKVWQLHGSNDHNEMSETYDVVKGIDIHGFGRGEVRPEEVKAHWETKLAILEEQIQEGEPA